MSTAALADAQPSGQIVGTVTDANGGPLPGATITLQGAAEREVQADADGRFAFQGLPAGQYGLHASLTGFAPSSRSLVLAADASINLSLTLWFQMFEETIVTVEKTGERDLLKTPMAVTVLTGDELRRVQAPGVQDVAGRAPSVTFSQHTGFAQLTIRGIGTNVVFAGSDPSSAVYVDGVYLARPAMLFTELLDLERVEVLRGPQGTLYGRNAMGGAVNVITKAPTHDLEAEASVVGGNLSALRAGARVSGPIVAGRLMGSAAFLRGFRQGFVRDLNHPDHPLGGDDVTAARGKLQVAFDSRSELLLSGDVTHQDAPPLTYAKVLAVKPGFQVDNPDDLHEVRTSALADTRYLQYGAAARLTVRLAPDTTMTSLTAFRKLDNDVVADLDVTELDLTISHVHEIQRQLSEELTISQRRSGLTWIGGVFLFDELDRQPTLVNLGGPRLENHLDPEVHASTQAVFGQATVDLTRRVSATAGVRYTHERKTIDNAGRFQTIAVPAITLPGSSYEYTDSISHTAWSPKFGLQVTAGQDAFAYVSATRGFKSGGFNPSSPEPGRGYAPEWAWSYEGGLKTLLAGGRARLSIAAFQTDYQDLQVQTAIRPAVLDISNAAAATIRGIELEGATRFAALRVGGHLAWLDARYDRYTAVGVGGIMGDVAGQRLNNAPEWSGRLWLEWTRAISGAGVLSGRAESTWQSTVFFTPFNDTIQRQRPYGLLDLSVEFSPRSGPWSIGAFARNLTGEDYITGTLSAPPPAIGGRPGDTRRVGIQLTVAR